MSKLLKAAEMAEADANAADVSVAKELSTKRPTFKIIVVGDSGVGKTCLTYRFCSGKFPSR